MAEWKGLEPSTSCVTGRRSNQLNYHSKANGDYFYFYYLDSNFDLAGIDRARSNQLNYHSKTN